MMAAREAAGGGAVTVVGSCNIDLIAYTPRFPAPGETVFGSRFARGFGGKGANQCVAAARLARGGHAGTDTGGGRRVAMVGAVGDDGFGREYVAALAAEGVDVGGVATVAGVSTGVAPIWVNGDGENCIVVVPGANASVSSADVAAAGSVVGSAAVVLCQNEIPLSATAAALAAGAAGGAVTIFTPAPVPAEPLPDDLLAATDVLVPNAGEVLALAGGGGGSGGGAGTDKGTVRREVREAAQRLVGRGVRAVVVTLGSAGALVTTAARAAHVAATPVTAVVDTTGAGDAFSGALAYFLAAAGAPPTDFDALLLATRRAAVYAADSVTKAGTQSSYATAADLPPALFTDPAWPGLPAVTDLPPL